MIIDVPIKIEEREIKEYKIKAPTRRGILLSLLSIVRNNKKLGINLTNLELEKLLEEAITRDTEVKRNANETIKLNEWKGKSSIDIIERPDSFLVITYEREDQDHKPKKIETILTKEEINFTITAINKLSHLDKIQSKLIAEQFCKLQDLRYTRNKEDMFANGSFNFKVFFSDRSYHLRFNLCLRLLDKKELIKYRGGKTQILTNPIEKL
jgi:hypothetical protein